MKRPKLSSFWLVLTIEDVHGMRENVYVYDSFLPMVYDMTKHPERAPSPAVVCQGQIDRLIDEAKIAIDAEAALLADEPTWTATCKALIDERMSDRIDNRMMNIWRS